MNNPTYRETGGRRWTTAQINRKSDIAAKLLLREQRIEHGYNYCTECLKNDCKPIDVAHLVSRKTAKENGIVEILWSSENMKILGRRCHQILDGLI